jgi:hypothetical protein
MSLWQQVHSGSKKQQIKIFFKTEWFRGSVNTFKFQHKHEQVIEHGLTWPKY